MNYSLYLITDPLLAKGSLISTVKSAILGGVTMVQYRNKHAQTKTLIKEASMLRKITKEKRVPLIINDRVDVALAVDADGVHVGQDDMPINIARKLLGAKKIIGASVKTLKQAKQAEEEGADYLGVGSVFATKTKTDAGKPIGLERLKQIVSLVNIPVVGIGGIAKENAAEVIKAGAKGVAVASAIMGKENPQKEARELVNIVRAKSRTIE